MKCSFVVLAAAAFSTASFGGVIDTVVDTTPGGAVIDGTVNFGEYIGNVSGGGGGFGGPVGGGMVSVDSDANGIQIGFSNLGDISGNSIRVYFDVRQGGYSELSDGAGFNDFADFGRERLSRPARDGLILPFEADFGWIISPAFGGFQALFELVPGGDNSLNFAGFGVTGTAIGENPSNATFEFNIPYADLGGLSPGDTVDFFVIYANNNGQDDAFMSNEGFPFQGFVDNPGFGPVTTANFHRLVTVPAPGAAALLGFAAMAARRRR